MPALKVKHRPVGATAVLGPTGRPTITTPTGGSMEAITVGSDPGFNPLDLLYASLATCLAISARIAASELGLLDRITMVRVQVIGEKAPETPSRVLRIASTLALEGDLDTAQRCAIAEHAERICTVSNTLARSPELTVTVQPE
ncbi:OsmC family peroxiredoxin [Pseudorhizobium endolithicum]|uniref:OsmC family peroxiredoxin n=1 Tax=Pseudorhizobium endolithicum TaxID=1191678 RepID=A0ABM8PXS4_9HYPH|nr:OsmC family protein [Pseudorhizobium endolithicum]CAD7054129.1 OsmC family peroxiredoxin [Pseudorhizobium endolithicum]